MVGTKYVLGSRAKQIGCVDSKAALDNVVNAVMKNDDIGFHEALAEGGALVLEPGSHVLVLDYSIFSGYLHLRVTSGTYEGVACWMAAGVDNDKMLAKQL